MIEIVVAALLVLGGFFAFMAALGVLRLPDLFIRMHASTKAGTLGCGHILLALALHYGETGIVTRALATIVFLMVTAPIAAHMIGRAAYRTGVPLWRGTVIDDLGRTKGPEAGAGDSIEDAIRGKERSNPR